ncbi:gibberellin-regulated protein 12 [Ananas comosus]|uniref:Gibberellin-regulated protein 12 n=1 Tax=Ananas comosus TaxID=4615 RepID=A0A6P5FWY2_ANACO|nr:gibberellin-regulated protein 12 [Ananas comosus]
MGRSPPTHVFIFFLLILLFSEAISVSAEHKQHKHSGFSQSECPGACQYRCSKTAYKKPCLFFCQECCFKCKCVPPGTYAHKESCPCYNNWKTKRGGPKCP